MPNEGDDPASGARGRIARVRRQLDLMATSYGAAGIVAERRIARTRRLVSESNFENSE
jgi:hypothetical protein